MTVKVGTYFNLMIDKIIEDQTASGLCTHKYVDTEKWCCIKCSILRPPQLSEPSLQGEVISFMRYTVYMWPKAHILTYITSMCIGCP